MKLGGGTFLSEKDSSAMEGKVAEPVAELLSDIKHTPKLLNLNISVLNYRTTEDVYKLFIIEQFY